MKNQLQNGFRLLPIKKVMSQSEFLDTVLAFLDKLNIYPNHLTYLTLIIGISSGILFALSHPTWASILVILCGGFDILDGRLAEFTNKKSLFGAILDSTIDRYSEFFIYLGLAVYFRNHWTIWIIFFAFLGSVLVSYTKARAEGLGIKCEIGIMQRAERMSILFLGAFIGSIFNIFIPFMIASLVMIAVISNITAFQRVYYVKKVENQHK